MKTYLVPLALLLTFSFYSCTSDSDDPDTLCGDVIIVDMEMYDTANTEYYSIVNANITDDCLEIEISSGGCDGERWEVKLIDSEAIAESYPVQRFIKLHLLNEEPCDAVINKKYSFDLTPIQLNYDTIIINLEKWDNKLVYSY